MREHKQLIITLIIGFISLIAHFIFHYPSISYYLISILAFLSAVKMAKGMYEDLKEGNYGVDILALTAIIVTSIVGDYWATYLILVMMATGDSLETFAENRANSELKALIAQSPTLAHRLDQSSKQVSDISVDEIELGDILIVKPGEVIPVDGTIIDGTASLDESSLTGESRLIEKSQGDDVLSGAIVDDKSIRIKAIRLASDSQYQTLVRLVDEARKQPGHFVRLADRYAVPFTAISYFIAGMAWLISGDLTRLAQVLVVATPCPLLLSAPIAMVAGMNRSSKNGILVKSGSVLEKLNRANKVAFDKTGTLTKGKLALDHIIVASKDVLSQKELLAYAASVEQESSHILARSVVEKAKEEHISLYPLDQIEEVVAQGVIGHVQGHLVKIGKAVFVDAPMEARVDQTAIYIAVDNQYAGAITFTDQVRPESSSTIEELYDLGIEETFMLTGDHKNIAQQIGEKLHLSNIYADLLPKDKIALLQDNKDALNPIVMVGDGVNDAPALATADVGIAMGANGNTAASESADAVILQDNLAKVASVIKISKDTLRIAKEAVLIGITLSIIAMLLASTGRIPTIAGAFLQEIIDVISMLWALRAYKS